MVGKVILLLNLWLATWVQLVVAQKGLGMRFATDINYFHRAKEYDLITGTFSNFVIGPFYRHYGRYAGMEFGAHFCYKGVPGSFNLPGVMSDFNKGQSTALTGYEFDFKFGPRIARIFYPKSGYVVGSRTKQIGFFQEGKQANRKLNTLYMYVPVGFSVDLPTGFGTTGFGFYYRIGLLNVIQNPGTGYYDGGKMRAFHLEITVTFGENG
ncbi:MAG: hypothetical protein NZ108_04095, partial [Bacteroidia bacterium]|nr:hypothetical protein [Bacteroidia bacterium]